MKSLVTQTGSALGCGASVVQAHPGQELDAGALDQFAITDGLRSPGGVVVEVPVRPGPVLALVIDELEQVFGHAHLARADALALGDARGIDRAGDDIHVTAGPARVFFRGGLDRGFPCTAVVLGRLGHHVDQRKALGHGLRRGHLAGRRQVTAVKSAALVVGQRGPLGRPKACIGEKLVGTLLVGIKNQRTVEPLRHVHGRLAFARVKKGKGVVAQRPLHRPGRDHGQNAAGEKLRAGRKVPTGVARVCHGGHRRPGGAGRRAGGLTPGLAQIPGQFFQGIACSLNGFCRNVDTGMKGQAQRHHQADRDQAQFAAGTSNGFSFFHQGQEGWGLAASRGLCRG